MLLEKMKKGVGKVVITVLAVLLIISFAVWGHRGYGHAGR